MGDLLYLRHSTDKQTNARQRHALATYMEAGAPVFEDPATSSHLHPLKRPGFRGLLEEAAVDDVVRLADAARLFRSVRDVLDVRKVLRRRGLRLRVATGAWAGMDLIANDPMTKLFVTMLAGVLEFQRDMISENTKDGVAAARAQGKRLGRPPRLGADEVADIVKAHSEGAAVKALARKYSVDPQVIRRALDASGARSAVGGSPAEAQEEAQVLEVDPVAVVDVPGLVAEHLADAADDAVRQALADGQVIRRGQGYLVRVSAPVSVHTAMIEQSSAAVMQSPAGRKAHRIHSGRVEAVRAG